MLVEERDGWKAEAHYYRNQMNSRLVRMENIIDGKPDLELIVGSK